MNNNPPPNCSAAPYDDKDLLCWHATIIGPPNTPYEGGEFRLSIQLPIDYPNSPPEVIFCTDIYHPNIDNDGEVFLSILYGDWSSSFSISEVLLAIYCLLINPDLDNAIDGEIAGLYQQHREEFEEIATQWTQKFAIRQD